MVMTGFDLNKAMTDIDERFIDEADFAGTKTAVTGDSGVLKKSRRKMLRIALVAACLVVLIAGTVVAASGVLKKDPFLELISEDNGPEELGEAYIPIGITKEGPVTVTLENIIGDDESVYCEFSTDLMVPNQQDGWLEDLNLGYTFTVSGEALIPEERWKHVILPTGLEAIKPGHATGYTPFCRDGRLWWLLSIVYTDEDVSINDVPMRVEITVTGVNDGSSNTYLFEWTNDYESKMKTIPVNTEFDEYTLSEVRLSVTKVTVYAETADIERENRNAQLNLDYIKLEDGSVWEYLPQGGPRVKMLGGHYSDGESVSYRWNFGLIGEFRQKENGAIRVIPYNEIVAICVNGTEISLR